MALNVTFELLTPTQHVPESICLLVSHKFASPLVLLSVEIGSHSLQSHPSQKPQDQLDFPSPVPPSIFSPSAVMICFASLLISTSAAREQIPHASQNADLIISLSCDFLFLQFPQYFQCKIINSFPHPIRPFVTWSLLTLFWLISHLCPLPSTLQTFWSTPFGALSSCWSLRLL